VEHYILEGVITLCFWLFRNLGTFELQAETNAEITATGCVIRLRSVLRGLTMSSQAHFTVYLYTPTWVFLCLFLAMGS